MYILRLIYVKLKKAAMENNRSYIFQREKEVAILKKKLSRD